MLKVTSNQQQSYKLQVISKYNMLQVCDIIYILNVTSYKLHVMSCTLQVTSYMLQATCYKLHSTCKKQEPISTKFYNLHFTNTF